MLSPSINCNYLDRYSGNKFIQATHDCHTPFAVGNHKQMLGTPKEIPASSVGVNATNKRPYFSPASGQIEWPEQYYNKTGYKSGSNKAIKLHHHSTISQDHKQQPQQHNAVKQQRQQPQQQESADGRHLVKTIADLPVFVTLEVYRIASYSISGEPYLCLPQLLQCLKRKFTLTRIVEKFEESMISFTPASAKQIEGFVKASVLPPDAKFCPMIKRTDADRICLWLFEQCSPIKRGDIVDLCSKNNLNYFTNYPKSNSIDKHLEDSSTNATIATQPELPNFRPLSHLEVANTETLQATARLEADNMIDKCNNIIENDRCNQGTAIESVSGKVREETLASFVRPNLETRHIKNEGLEATVDKMGSFFGTEAQNPILALAKAVTSTLILRVYHRCFGKCVGLYYPSLLRSPGLECIECATCHVMLSPRRFIGHTHGPKENDVCHWGFNSYNWRYYIRLSRKQTTNSLDDDELLFQFKNLQSVSDNVDQVYNETVDKACYSFSSNNFHPKSEFPDNNSFKISLSPIANYQSLASKRKSISVYRSIEPKSITEHPSHCRERLSCATESRNPFHPLTQTTGVVPNPSALSHLYGPGKRSMTDIPNSRTSSYQQGLISPFATTSNPLLQNTSLGVSTTDDFVLARPMLAADGPSKSNDSLPNQVALETDIKRDIYICTNLTSYLNGVGMSSNLVKDIVENTLNVIRASRMLF